MARYQSTTNSPDVGRIRGHAKDIFDAGIEAVSPDRLVKNCLKFDGSMLTVKVGDPGVGMGGIHV